MIDSRKHSLSASSHERVADMLSALDAVLLLLPDDPSDQMVDEIERVVTTLRTADEHFCGSNTAGALQMLDLARARIDRFVDTLDPEEDADTDDGEKPPASD